VAELPYDYSDRIIGPAIDVHRALGPGLLESIYEECLYFELKSHGIRFRRQVALPVVYKSVNLDCGFRADLIVEDLTIVELKTVERILPVHEAQLLTYLRISGLPTGLILNFYVPVLKDGIKRMVLSR
jgi:GxxExxY protein